MRVNLIHTTLGNVTLTDEHAASSYGQPVVIDDTTGAALGAADMPHGYLHAVSGRMSEHSTPYTAEQLAWIDDQVVRAHTLPYEQGYRFGATLKTRAQLDRIEAESGARVARNK